MGFAILCACYTVVPTLVGVFRLCLKALQSSHNVVPTLVGVFRCDRSSR